MGWGERMEARAAARIDDRREALVHFSEAFRLALGVYTGDGALVLLTGACRAFDGATALELIARGESERVFEFIASLNGMVAT